MFFFTKSANVFHIDLFTYCSSRIRNSKIQTTDKSEAVLLKIITNMMIIKNHYVNIGHKVILSVKL